MYGTTSFGLRFRGAFSSFAGFALIHFLLTQKPKKVISICRSTFQVTSADAPRAAKILQGIDRDVASALTPAVSQKAIRNRRAAAILLPGPVLRVAAVFSVCTDLTVGLQEAVDRIGERSRSSLPAPVPLEAISVPMLAAISRPALGSLRRAVGRRVWRLLVFSDSRTRCPIVETVNVERAIALVSTHFSTARPEELTGPEVSPICVEFAVCFHGVNITSRPAKSMD